jgi:HNH endonuclease
MKQIPLSQGKVALVDDEDFEYLNQWKWHAYLRKETWYAMRTGPRPVQSQIYMHRVITDAPKGTDVDHWDHNGLNNQRENLRVCTHSENMANMGAAKRNLTGYKGVTTTKHGRFAAKITIKLKCIYLGTFTAAEEAARAYDDAARKFFGKFAKTNFEK